MDIIEYALSNYTDFLHFEQLCLEVLGYYGYPRIKKVGGYKDDGVDAISSEIYYDETQTKRVFQFTMQKDTKGKVSDTTRKLDKNKIDYEELILVTSQLVNNIDGITKKYRLDNGKSLQIYDISTFVTILSQHRDIFLRYFPDIKSQIESDFYKENIFSDSAEDQLTMSMIKSTLLYSLSPELNTQLQRKNLFDKSILSTISLTEEGLSIDEIINEFHTKFGRILPDSQIKASLDRLQNKGLSNFKEGKYKASRKAKESMLTGIAHVEQRTNALISDIIAHTHIVADGIKCSQDDDKQMMYNLQKTLNLFFKFYGTDLAIDVDAIVPEMIRQEELTKLLSSNLKPELAECLVYSFGCILGKPTEEQAYIISLWAKAFIGTQLMKLDPMLGDFQRNAFSDKSYILDTDFVLNCMVKHGRFSEIYSFLLNELIKMGCNIIIPDSVVQEVITHAEFSRRNFNYFRNTFEAIDESVVYEKVKNVFVIDYFVSRLNQSQDYSAESFSSYLSNIYEPSAPHEFMLEVMRTRLPKGIRIGDTDLQQSADINSVEREELTKTIYDETIKTAKAAYRTDEENMQIAKTDADLFLTARNLNKGQPIGKDKTLLYGKAYLITNSTRSIRCAKAKGIFSPVVAKPNVLIALISEIGLFDVSNKTIINLLGNPFLAEVVEHNWDGMKSLIDSGVDLRGKELPRLKHDLKHVIHTLLTIDSSEKELTDPEKNEDMTVPQMEDLNQYIHYANILHNKGYKLIPTAEKLIQVFEKLKEDHENQQIINDRIKKELEKIGKGKQRYLLRIGKIETSKTKLKKN